ncbi:MAG TPA: hypothetical protein PKA56_03830 [Solirubrobacterales bacterium]|nr:hypothetical protein [Solirubrobacterales bacterium]HMW44634.1 hypothetical protein [Solirubrobacterales bacterium]HMX70862.1 hypothetical protein [Solirubrobacterales bacterium]HMY25091.1 hypothetical protein [Solirubrobacterales bacterium]HNA23157.1 hypothetical protein [Solirubrobacterales bacterium]
MIGSSEKNRGLRWAGRPTFGNSDSRAPGFMVEVSGERQTATAANPSAASRIRKIRVVGQGANWISTPQPSAPIARPASGATPFTTPLRFGSSSGCRSTITALSVASATPVARPWITLARASIATPPESRNSRRERASKAIAPSSTGRLPR